MTAISQYIKKSYWFEPISAAPLAVYRIGFGLLMLFSTLRFMLNGWVDAQYIQPKFHFSYYGFEWLPYPSEAGIYTLFIIMIISSILIALGLFYRFGTVLFFLSFTYVELLDKANYLNHYYFVSLIAFLLIFIPANRYFSLDARLGIIKGQKECARWNRGILQFQIAIVYIFAGIAKLESDWLLEAQPLKYWLHTAHHYPLIGEFLKQDWVAYLFAWFGCLYDLFIVFFLLQSKTRKYAYFFVIAFHLITWILFPIGVFPWVMIFATLIFFSAEFHERILQRMRLFFGASDQYSDRWTNPPMQRKWVSVLLSFYIVFQLAMPFRYLLYEGDLLWTEQGFRFSWRVMLMEKSGHATFYVKDEQTGAYTEIDNSEYLTPNQENMMSTQADMVLQFAHFLKDEFTHKTVNHYGVEMQFISPEVQAEVYVALNSRPHQLLIDPKHNLSSIDFDLKEKYWLEAFQP